MPRFRILKPRSRGQALVEFALVFPVALMTLAALVTLGLWVFYQQMVTNVAREAARYAAIHSSTAICPTSGWRDPEPVNMPSTGSYKVKPFNCDGPDNPNDAQPWPYMSAHARRYVWGTNPNAVNINACWSGHLPPSVNIASYANYSAAAGFPQADYPPIQPDGAGGTQVNQFVPCTIDGWDPVTESTSMGCRSRMTTAGDDPASDIPGNQVTVYACYQWAPPMAGFLFIPSSVTMRAVVTESIHRQQ